MTVIAYRDGVMASDSMASVGDLATGFMRKVVRSNNGYLAGASGDSGDCQRWLDWVLSQGSDDIRFEPHDPDLGAMLVSPDGTVRRLGLKGSAYVINAPYHAMGIGREIATGAMAAGASAERAVAIAIEHMDSCGGPIQVVRLWAA